MFATTAQTVRRAVVGTIGTALCATICLLGATVPAHAGTVEPRSIEVSYSDLNLGNAEGRATLDRRIRRAARMVCSTGAATLAARSEEVRCIRSAIASAMPQVAAARAPATIG